MLWGAPCSSRVSPLLNLSRSQSIAICHIETPRSVRPRLPARLPVWWRCPQAAVYALGFTGSTHGDTLHAQQRRGPERPVVPAEGRGLLEVLGEAYLAESLLGAGVEHGRLPKQTHGLILVLAVGQHAPNALANSGSGAVAGGDKGLSRLLGPESCFWIST